MCVVTNLSISKDGGIVALKTAFNEFLCAVGVDGFLLGVHVKDIVVGKGLVLTQDHLRLPRHHIRTNVTTLDLLFGQLRANPVRQKETMKEKLSTVQPKDTFLTAFKQGNDIPALTLYCIFYWHSQYS